MQTTPVTRMSGLLAFGGLSNLLCSIAKCLGLVKLAGSPCEPMRIVTAVMAIIARRSDRSNSGMRISAFPASRPVRRGREAVEHHFKEREELSSVVIYSTTISRPSSTVIPCPALDINTSCLLK
jgi:hypothetical protein